MLWLCRPMHTRVQARCSGHARPSGSQSVPDGCFGGVVALVEFVALFVHHLVELLFSPRDRAF